MPSAFEPRPETRRISRLRMTRRGAVLLVSISVLVVLALLATVFASMAEIERNISRNYVDDVRARLLAESGIQEAISKIQQALDRGEDLNNNNALDPGEDRNGNGRLDKSWPEVTTWWYHGEDRNANGVLEAGEDRDGDGRLDTLDCRLEDALRPSFAVIDAGGPAGRARQIFIQEPSGVRPTSVCGALSVSSYGRNADQYTLKIVDTSSQIYLNDRNPNLARILNSLSLNLGGPNDVGTRIMAGRPPLGYSSKYDLLTRQVITPAEFDRIKNMITAFAWVDPNVCNPVPLSQTEHNQPHHLVKGNFGEYWRPSANGTYRNGLKIYRSGPSWALNTDIETRLTKAGRNELRTTTNTQWTGPVTARIPPEATVYGVDELNTQWIEVTSRAPVNINTASKEVLMSLIEGLDGFYLVERNRFATTNAYTWMQTQELPGVGFRRIGLSGGGTASAPTTAVGSEIGVLYRTGPILGPAGTSSAGIRGTAGINRQGLAEIIARKIVEYRSGLDVIRATTGGFPDIREGPFTSWAQFNEFCDRLVLDDGSGNEVRSAIMEGSAVNWPASFPEASVHAQARIDVLKANFNPNLHLNEANPDESLFAWVDKTDLVVASTEFCFTPMGIFEIESLGRVARPAPLTADALAAGTNIEVLAEKKIVANLKIYDAFRETTQRQFYGDRPSIANTPEDSSVGPQVRATMITSTNNRYAIQSYPEPENGDAPYDTEYEGYLALSTYGGYPGGLRVKRTMFTNLPVAQGTSSTRTTARYRSVVSTTSGSSGISDAGSGGAQSAMMESARAHFDSDFNLTFSIVQGTRFTSAGNQWFGERRVHFARRFERSRGGRPPLNWWYNHPAPSETRNNNPGFGNITAFRQNNVRGPYCLSDAIDGELAPNYDSIAPRQREFRVTRSFRVNATTSAGGSLSYTPRATDTFYNNLPFHQYAPSSLRADGGYIERNNVPLWSPTRAQDIRSTLWRINAPVNIFQGTVSYWIKPNFFPELAGKARSYFSLASMREELRNPAGGSQVGFANPNPFTHIFLPNHSPVPPGRAPRGGVTRAYSTPTSTTIGTGPALLGGPLRSFLFGFGYGERSGYVPGSGYFDRPLPVPDRLRLGDPPPTLGAKPMVAGTQSDCLNWVPLTNRWAMDRTRIPDSQRPFDAHKWVHIVLTWRMYDPVNPNRVPDPACEIWINGRLSSTANFMETVRPLPGSLYRGGDPRHCNNCDFAWDVSASVWDDTDIYTQHEPWRDPHPRHQGHFSYHWFWDKIRNAPPPAPPTNPPVQWNPQPPGTPARYANANFHGDWISPMRIGEPTALVQRTVAGNLYTRNHNPDSTVDEFWLWQYVDPTNLSTRETAVNGGRAGGLGLWRQGRYYRGNNGWFRSRTINVTRNTQRGLPPPVGATTGPVASRPPVQEIVGVAWTQQAKRYDSSRPTNLNAPGLNKFVQYDYRNAVPESRPLPTGIEMQVSPNNGGSWYGQTGTAGSRLMDPAWSVPFEDNRRTRRVRLPLFRPLPPLPPADETRLKYQAFFRTIGASSANSILLDSPVLDDVTIYYTVGWPQVLDWVIM